MTFYLHVDTAFILVYMDWLGGLVFIFLAFGDTFLEGNYFCTNYSIFMHPIALKNYGRMWLIVQKEMKRTMRDTSPLS